MIALMPLIARWTSPSSGVHNPKIKPVHPETTMTTIIHSKTSTPPLCMSLMNRLYFTSSLLSLRKVWPTFLLGWETAFTPNRIFRQAVDLAPHRVPRCTTYYQRQRISPQHTNCSLPNTRKSAGFRENSTTLRLNVESTSLLDVDTTLSEIFLFNIIRQPSLRWVAYCIPHGPSPPPPPQVFDFRIATNL